jgi:hypothetical protein
MAGRVDLLDSVKGMYRILDLVSERGSDGTGLFWSSRVVSFFLMTR